MAFSRQGLGSTEHLVSDLLSLSMWSQGLSLLKRPTHMASLGSFSIRAAGALIQAPKNAKEGAATLTPHASTMLPTPCWLKAV